MTNAWLVSLAYKMAALQLMLGEATFFVEKLKLPIPTPLEVNNLEKHYISPPKLGFGGSIEIHGYYFYFSKERKLWRLTKIDTPYRHYETWQALKKAPSLVDTNGAYELAKTWLKAVGANVPALERQHKPRVWQFEFLDPPDPENPPDREHCPKSKLPIFHVGWGEGDSPPVKVVLLGTTKELMELAFNDIAFSTRPPLVVPNEAALLSRPDHLTSPATNAVLKRAPMTNAPASTNGPPKRVLIPGKK